MKIAIDVGSSDTPLVNQTFGITAYDLNCKLVELLKANLNADEYVILEATSEQHLEELIKETKPSKCITLGYSYYNGIVSGTETFVSISAGGNKFGKGINENVVEALGLRDRGVSKLETQFKIPYAQVNLGFIDHDVDVMVIESNLAQLAQAIVESI